MVTWYKNGPFRSGIVSGTAAPAAKAVLAAVLVAIVAVKKTLKQGGKRRKALKHVIDCASMGLCPDIEVVGATLEGE